jgi:hypothetical protein
LSCGSTDMASSETLWAKPEDPNTTPGYGWHTVVCINLEAILLIKGLVQAKLISRELRLEPKTMNVAGLQVADLLAHPAHRTFKFLKLGMPEPEDYGASLIKTLEAVYDRHPRSGAIEGCGIKWLP